MEALRDLPYKDLGFAKVDSHRDLRRGFPEVVLCLGKTPSRIVEIVRHMSRNHNLVLATRASAPIAKRLKDALTGTPVVYHEAANIIAVGKPPAPRRGVVLVVTACTSDIPVAEEAAVTSELMGSKVTRLYDVGVAGGPRGLDRRDLLRKAKVIVVVAGMERGPPSGLARPVDVPLVSVPASLGYRGSFDGMAAPP